MSASAEELRARVTQRTDYRDRCRQDADRAMRAFEEARTQFTSAVDDIRVAADQALDDPARCSIGNDQNLLASNRRLPDLGVTYIQSVERAIHARRALDAAEESLDKAEQDHKAAERSLRSPGTAENSPGRGRPVEEERQDECIPDRLRDKRPAYYAIYKRDFALFAKTPAKQRPYAIAAYNVIGYHANNQTDTAFPSYNTIAELSGMSRRMAMEAVRLLAEVVHDVHPNKNSKKEDEQGEDNEMWVQLKMMGIPDRPSYIRLIGRTPYDDPAATLEFARRKLAEKQRGA